MEVRENIISELHRRMSEVPNTLIVFRNPKVEPTPDDLNCISIFELGDPVEKASTRGGVPYYIRNLNVIIEAMIKSQTEGASSPDLIAYVKELKKKLYEGGITLGGTCDMFIEIDSSQILRPPIGGNAAGIGISLKITYKEDIRTYFT